MKIMTPKIGIFHDGFCRLNEPIKLKQSELGKEIPGILRLIDLSKKTDDSKMQRQVVAGVKG